MSSKNNIFRIIFAFIISLFCTSSYAEDMKLVMIAHKMLKTENLTLEQVKSIYLGKTSKIDKQRVFPLDQKNS